MIGCGLGYANDGDSDGEAFLKIESLGVYYILAHTN